MPVSYQPTARWQNGDIVSQVVAGQERFGRVVRLTRRSDGAPFLMVQVTGGAGIIGNREWPDGWVLGMGPRQHQCLGCRQDYRSNDIDEDFCPACMRSERRNMNHGDATRSVAASLRGAASQMRRVQPTATDEEIAAQKAADESESIF